MSITEETKEKDRRAIAAAIVAAQKAWNGVESKGEFNAEGKGEKKGFSYKYPKPDHVCDAVRACLTAQGLAATEADVPDEIVRRETAWIGRFPFDLVHESGAERRYVREFPISPSEKFAFGKACKMAKTECLKYWLLGLVCARGSEDDDGEEEVNPAAEKKAAEAPTPKHGVPPRAAPSPAAVSSLDGPVSAEAVARLRDLVQRCGFKSREEILAVMLAAIGRTVQEFSALTVSEAAKVEAALRKREADHVVASLAEEPPRGKGAAAPPKPATTAAVPAPAASATAPATPSPDSEPAPSGGEALRADPATCAHQPDETGFCWRCGMNTRTGEVGSPKPGPTSGAAKPTSAEPSLAAPASAAVGRPSAATAPTTSPVRNCATDKLLQDRAAVFARDGKAARLEADVALPAWGEKINGWAGKKVWHDGTGMAMHDVDEPTLRAICRGFDRWNGERKKAGAKA